MQKFFDSVLLDSGMPAVGVFVTISNAVGGALSTIFADNGITPKANPIITDDNGYFEFYAADGRYTITITAPTITARVISDVLLEDPLDPNPVNINGGTISNTTITVSASGGHFVQNGAKVQRLNDRVLIAAATDNDASFPNAIKDWLSSFQVAAGLSNGSIVSAASAVLNSNNNQSAQAFVAGSQTLNFTSASTSAIGSSGYVVNNNATLATKGWAFYGEAHKVNATSSAIYGMELDTRTLVDSINPNAYQQGDVIGLQLASGCELPAGPQFDASAAIQVEDNPKKFKAGINFGANSITGTDGVTGSGTAVSMAKGHEILWSRASGVPIARIGASSTTQSLWLDFTTDAIHLKTLAGSVLAVFDTSGRLTVGPLPTTARTISVSKTALNTEVIGSANNPQLFVKNTSGAALGEKAEVNFSISAQDYASASISAQFTVFTASGDVGADLIFATRKSTADGGLKERGRFDNSGNLLLATVGAGFRAKEGSNAKQGTAILVAGSAVVANTSVTANSRILITSNQDGGTPGFLRVSARSAGVSFTITSSSGTDTSVVAYQIFEPG